MSECDRFLDALSSDRLEQAHRTHARGCPICGPLLPGEAAVDAVPPPPSLEAVRSRALEVLRTTPVRPWTREARLLVLLQAGIALGMVAVLGPTNWRSPFSDQVALGAVAVVLLAVLTLGTVLALAPGRRRPRLLLWLVPLVPPLVVLSGNGVHTTSTLRSALPCPTTVVLGGAVPLAVGLALLRSTALDGARALALGLCAAATGLFVLHWHCGDGSAPHLLVFHLLPWLALGLFAIPLRRALPTRSHVP
jgi:hypothetical protein